LFAQTRFDREHEHEHVFSRLLAALLCSLLTAQIERLSLT